MSDETQKLVQPVDSTPSTSSGRASSLLRPAGYVGQAPQAGSEAIERYDEIAQLLTGKEESRAGDGVAWVRELCAALKVTALGEFGLKPDQFETISEKSRQSSSMKGNPIELTNDELGAILEKSL